MIARPGSGWQTVLADLSMILFMVTAAAVGEAPEQPPVAPLTALPALEEPVAVWSGGTGATALAEWLAEQGDDKRLRLTIVATRATGAAALDLANHAGRPARIIIEPAGNGPLAAFLTYDVHPQSLSRGETR